MQYAREKCVWHGSLGSKAPICISRELLDLEYPSRELACSHCVRVTRRRAE